jgi:RNA polymerase sigma factor (sigma-70 family)
MTSRSFQKQQPLMRRDAIALAHLSLADQIASATARRLRGLLDRDDLIQIAREALLHAAARCDANRPPEPYLRRCITGAIQRHIRDGVRLVRISRRAHEQRRGQWPLSHLSLDIPHPSGQGSWLEHLPSASPTGSTQEASIDALIDQLPAAQAAALRLTLLQGRSIRGAASSLGISASSLHRLRTAALQALRDQDIQGQMLAA